MAVPRGAKRGAQKRGAQKGGLKKGYSRIFNGAEKLLRVRATVFCGVLAGSARKCAAQRSSGPCGMDAYIGYSRRSAITWYYSHGTPTVLRCPAEHAALLRGLVAVAVGRIGQRTAVRGTRAYGLRSTALSSTHRVFKVLKGCSRGTHANSHGAVSWANVTQCMAVYGTTLCRAALRVSAT